MLDTIVENYRKYDEFLEIIKQKRNKDRIYYAFLSVRTALCINFNPHNPPIPIKNTPRNVLAKILYFFITVLPVVFSHPSLSVKDDQRTVVLGVAPQDDIVAQRIGAQTVNVSRTFSIISFFKNIQIIFECLLIKRYARESNAFEYSLSVYYLRYMASFLTMYRKLDFKNVKNVITNDDIFPDGFAVIQSAREQGIRTIKIDHFLIDDIYLNKIYCEYYFYPNEYHRGLLAKFPTNNHVKFIEGGFPAWDGLHRYRNHGDQTVKTIVFFTQYGSTYEEETRYIKDIVEFVSENEDFELIIKIHPRSEVDYSHFSQNRVTILRKNIETTYDLIARAAYTFSIFSVVTLEAKHICRQSYFINYDNENSSHPIDYKFFRSSVDIVESKDMLLEVLKGAYLPIEICDFVEKVNPSFPNTMNRLNELLV